MNLLITVFTKLMIGPGDQDVKRHTEIVELSGDGLASCPAIASYPIALNYAGVGAFVNGGGGRGLICGGYNDYNTTLESHTSTDRCFSWNSKVWYRGEKNSLPNIVKHYPGRARQNS